MQNFESKLEYTWKDFIKKSEENVDKMELVRKLNSDDLIVTRSKLEHMDYEIMPTLIRAPTFFDSSIM